MAREFGFQRGALNLVNWVSDQYSQYGTKVVSVAEREAIHTLEGILHTQLPIVEHTTDTHGATEIVFALFDLLGLRFIPRLRDAGDLLLHLLGPPTGLPVDAVMRSRARPQRIVEHYDDLLRTAASLKRGWVPAHPSTSTTVVPLRPSTTPPTQKSSTSEHPRIRRPHLRGRLHTSAGDRHPPRQRRRPRLGDGRPVRRRQGLEAALLSHLDEAKGRIEAIERGEGVQQFRIVAARAEPATPPAQRAAPAAKTGGVDDIPF
jgi:hypothetical protein